MIEKHSITLTGESGTDYMLICSAMSAQDETDGAVYVVSICGDDPEGGDAFAYKHSPVYLGRTDNLSTEFIDHPKGKCFELAAQAMKASKDMIAVGSIIENDEAKRAEIEKDLSGLYKWICNSWTP